MTNPAARPPATWWYAELGTLEYRTAWRIQTALVDARRRQDLTTDVVLLLEHPPVFTIGRRGGRENLCVSPDFLAQQGIPIVPVERGGNITFHGPGQLVAYFIVHLEGARLGVAALVDALEAVMLRTAAHWHIKAERNPRNRGVWVGPNKLGSIGLAVRRGISFHGLALNVNIDLTPFGWINPCGLAGVGMTSMQRESGRPLPMPEARRELRRHLETVFTVRLQPLPPALAKQLAVAGDSRQRAAETFDIPERTP
jgi:lipoate-protein ligase B